VCTTGDTAHIDTVFKLLPHTHTLGFLVTNVEITENIMKCPVYVYIYTGCPRRKGPNYGRVFLRSNYTDIIQNTYIQSSMVTEILNIEK